MPIAPYPSPSELYKLRMAELQRLLQQNGTFKSELMQAFLAAAQVSFREHQRNSNSNDNQKNKKNVQQKNGSESGYNSSTVSSPQSDPNQSPNIIDQNNQNKNHLGIDSKSGIIEDLDNFKITSETTSTMDNNQTTSTVTTSPTTGEVISKDIKLEPGLDNQEFATMNPLMDNSSSGLMGGMPPMPEAASPFMMPELSPDMMMMMPDMMEMMGDQSMMSGMMGDMMMPGKKHLIII